MESEVLIVLAFDDVRLILEHWSLGFTGEDAPAASNRYLRSVKQQDDVYEAEIISVKVLVANKIVQEEVA